VILFNCCKIRFMVLTGMVGLVLLLAFCRALVDFQVHKHELIENIDAQLFNAATFSKSLVPGDYHDRITDSNSVSSSAFEDIVSRNNDLCEELGMEYLWSLILLDDHPFFTTATSPDKKTENGLHAGFLEPHTNPEFYTETFNSMEPQLQVIHDKWGSLRSILVPHYDQSGRKYLFGACIRVADLQALTPRLLRETLLTTLIFLIIALPGSLLLSKYLTQSISRLAEAAELMASGNYREPIKVQGPTEINMLSNRLNMMRKSIDLHVSSLDQAMRQLREFEQIINASPAIIFRVRLEPGYPVELMSENFVNTGYSVADMLSGAVTWDQIIPAEDLDSIASTIEETLEAGKDTFQIEVRMNPPDGTETWYGNWNRIIRDASGVPTHVQCLVMDITSKKKQAERDAHYQNRLRALAQELSSTEDRERHRLAEVLHENMGQMLVALNLKVTAMHDTPDPEQAEKISTSVFELLGKILNTCKTLTWKLSPPSLYESDFIAGLQHMADDLEKLFGLKVEIESPEERLKIPADSAALLFQFARELLVNVAKHSGTNKAQLQIIRSADLVRLIVTDRGKGFKPEELENSKTRGFGLFNIRERLVSINGTMNTESISESGTKITLEVSLDALGSDQPG
jgi:PAS domain S-box-containing protein